MSRHYLTLNIGTRYRHSCSEILIGTYTPCSRVSFWMTFNDLEWLREIFNHTKHRAHSRGLFATAELLVREFFSRATFCLVDMPLPRTVKKLYIFKVDGARKMQTYFALWERPRSTTASSMLYILRKDTSSWC